MQKITMNDSMLLGNALRRSESHSVSWSFFQAARCPLALLYSDELNPIPISCRALQHTVDHVSETTPIESDADTVYSTELWCLVNNIKFL